MRSHPPTPATIALLGAGRVGTAVGVLLKRAGHSVVGVRSRSRAAAESSARRLGTVWGTLDEPVPEGVDLVLIGVADAAIREIASLVAPALRPGATVVHFAGSLGLEVLAPITDRGVGAAALHPVQSCPDVDAAIARLPGCAWGVTTSPGLEEWAAELIERDLGGRPLPVAEKDRALWHAAAVTTSNAIAGLLASGEALLGVINSADPIGVLGPLALGTVTNAMERGSTDGVLTGPLVRGDLETIERHLATIRERAPELEASYAAAARVVLESARREGKLDAETALRVEDLLGPR